MNDNTISDINPEVPRNAVSVYSQDNGLDDFPVLKAFQQYIDAEHAKARKRLVTMGVFFVILMGAVIAVFVAMLVLMSQRNQQLNDRLLEFAMRDRDRQPAAPVVVQPAAPQAADGGMLQALTAKLDELQKKFLEREAKAEAAAKEAARAAEEAKAREEAKAKGPTPEQAEIERLKALLAAERNKAAVEKERKRQEELEAYRRKHYPELYRPVEQKKPPRRPKPEGKAASTNIDEIDKVLELLEDDGTVDYFDDDKDGDEDEADEAKSPAGKAAPKKAAQKKTAGKQSAKKEPQAEEPAKEALQKEEPAKEEPTKEAAAQANPPARPDAAPAEAKKPAKSGWRIPEE